MMNRIYSYKLSVINREKFVNAYNFRIRQCAITYKNNFDLTITNKLQDLCVVFNQCIKVSCEDINQINIIKFNYSTPSLQLIFNNNSSMVFE